MSHRSRFVPAGTPTPAQPEQSEDSTTALNEANRREKDKLATENNANVFSPVPKLNLSSLKKKAAATSHKTRSGHHRAGHMQGQQQTPRTLIIPPTVEEVDENENPSAPGNNNDNINNANSTKEKEKEPAQFSPRVSLSRRTSQPDHGHPHGQPPAYTSSYVPPPSFIDAQHGNTGMTAFSQLSQTHIHASSYPVPASPAHILSAAGAGFSAAVPPAPSALRTVHSHGYHPPPPPGAPLYPHELPSGMPAPAPMPFGRPSTPHPPLRPRSQTGGNERERDKRASTEDSERDRDQEELYNRRNKRSRLGLGLGMQMEFEDGMMDDNPGSPYSRGHTFPPMEYATHNHPHGFAHPSELNMNMNMNVPQTQMPQMSHVSSNIDPHSAMGMGMDPNMDGSNSNMNLDAYINAHLDKFEEAKRKWADCSLEEWQAGADEITSSFASLLTSVKDRLTSKLTLYASLSTRCADRMEEIEEKGKELAGVRKEMEATAGGVVGKAVNEGANGGGKAGTERGSRESDGTADVGGAGEGGKGNA